PATDTSSMEQSVAGFFLDFFQGRERIMSLSKFVHFCSIVCACLATARLLALHDFNIQLVSLDKVINHAQAGLALPLVGVLLWASFDPAVINKISGLNVYFFIAAITLAYVSVSSLLI
ncbi:hypothetical protein, partial [Vibrio parahaemolyticus]